MPDVRTPVDGEPWPQGDFYDDAPLWSPSGVVDALPSFTGSTIQPTYNVGAMRLGLSVAGSTITASIEQGRARVRGQRYRRTTTAWTTNVPLNSSGNPRRDRIVLRRDLAAKTCTPVFLQGTPATTPSSPALTQVDSGVWDMPLFSFVVAGGSSTAVTGIIDERPFISAEGGRLLSPVISGTLARSDWPDANSQTINANTTTGLKLVPVSQSGPWQLFNGPGSVGVALPWPGRFRIHGLMPTNATVSRWEQLRSTVGGAIVEINTGGTHKAGFGGAGGSVDVDCPAGLTLYMEHFYDGTVAGNIREGSRWSAEFLRPLV